MHRRIPAYVAALTGFMGVTFGFGLGVVVASLSEQDVRERMRLGHDAPYRDAQTGDGPEDEIRDEIRPSGSVVDP